MDRIKNYEQLPEVIIYLTDQRVREIVGLNIGDLECVYRLKEPPLRGSPL